MKNKIFINEDGIIEQVYAGRQTFQKIVKTGGATMMLRDKLRKEKRNLKMIADLSGVTSFTPDALIAAADSMKTSFPTKTAFYGGSKLVNGLVGLLIAASGNTNDFMVFEKRADALKWLRK